MEPNELKYKLKLPKGAHRSNPHPEVYGPELPRVTRLMALAIWFEDILVQHPELSYSDLARLSGVCRSRITQILNLLYLAPDLQERLLSLAPNPTGRDRIHEPAFRKITQIEDWNEQRQRFEVMFGAKQADQNEH